MKKKSSGNTKIITVLFTRYHGMRSDVVYYISGRGYTHASIALDEDNMYYYSFNLKGFRKEFPKKHKNIYHECLMLKLEISEKSFFKIKNRIEKMEKRKNILENSSFGVFLCLLRIPLKRKNHYFCSQFVAEVLQNTDEIELRHKPSTYFPNRLLDELKGQKCIKEVVLNTI